MTDTKSSSAPRYDAYPFDLMALARLLIVGMITGAAGWLLYLAIAHYFIDPVFCRTATTFAVCRNGGTIAWAAASIIVAGAAVAVLAKLAIYRPLLIVLGALVALWGAHAWLGGMVWRTCMADCVIWCGVHGFWMDGSHRQLCTCRCGRCLAGDRLSRRTDVCISTVYCFVWI